MWWATCSHLPVLPQAAGRSFIFAGLRAPYLWMFPWAASLEPTPPPAPTICRHVASQLFGANTATRANHSETGREPTTWSQLCRPRHICGATPGSEKPPFGFRWVQMEGLNCHPPACYGPPSERDSLAAPEARRRCCGPVGPRTTNWGALCLCARHGGPFQKVQEVILFFKNVQKLKMQYQTCVFVNSIYFELSVQATDFDFGWA